MVRVQADLLRPLLIAGLIWPAAAGAQDFSVYTLQAERCRSSPVLASCRAALEQSHLLKNWAEGRKRWRCYTAVLGAEAEMIAAMLRPETAAPALDAHQEMLRACRS